MLWDNAQTHPVANGDAREATLGELRGKLGTHDPTLEEDCGKAPVKTDDAAEEELLSLHVPCRGEGLAHPREVGALPLAGREVAPDGQVTQGWKRQQNIPRPTGALASPTRGAALALGHEAPCLSTPCPCQWRA